jgi:hypothetical protein
MEMANSFKDLPKNWACWGVEDEIGFLNFLTSDEVLRGIRAVKRGKVLMLGLLVARTLTESATNSAKLLSDLQACY